MTNLAGTMIEDDSSPLSQWLWRGLMVAAGIVLLSLYSQVLDSYEIGIVVLAAVGLSFLGQNWPPFRRHTIVVAGLSFFALYLYGTDLALGQ